MTDITLSRSPKDTAVALGFFDGLHLGHIEVIKKTLGLEPDGLSPAVCTFGNGTALPKFSAAPKGQNIISYELKTELLEKTGVEYIYAPDFSQIRDMTAEEFVQKILKEKLRARRAVCGYDFHFAKGGSAGAEELQRLCSDMGIETVIVPAVTLREKVISSSAIRELIRMGDVKSANEMLGYELTYFLPVIGGNRIGKTLGFPTINQVIPEDSVSPKRGVYKSWTMVNGRNYPSVTNIGVKPTIALQKGEKERIPQMETHIIGFSGDLYGEKVKVSIREFIREEKKFSDTMELQRQLELDKAEAIVTKQSR